MLNHHVIFWLKEECTPAEKATFRKGLEALQDIETVRNFHVGVPAPIERAVVDSTYAFSLNLFFDDIKGMEVYQDHPLHLAFLEECRVFFDKIIIYDAI